jgi:purine-nucleoside phosphorylase
LPNHPEREIVAEIATALEKRFGQAPEVAVVLGSGFAPVIQRLSDAVSAPSTDFGLPQSTVVGHAGEIVVGTLSGVRVVAMSGRVHLYEGVSASSVVRGVRALHAWGVKQLLLTCSAGGVAPTLSPGTLVLISDHINLQGDTPLKGPAYATRFPDMTGAYQTGLGSALERAANTIGVDLKSGVYAAMSGPAYETPAEVRMARIVGADMVGMSTVPEALAAVELGFPVCAVAVISNVAAGLSDEALLHDDVTRVTGAATVDFARVLEVALADYTLR